MLVCGSAFAQTPTPASQPPPVALERQQDYKALRDAVMNEGFEAFAKKEPATQEEFQEYVHLLSEIVEMQTVREERIATNSFLQSETTQVRKSIDSFTPPEISPDTGLNLYDSSRIDLWQAQNWLQALDKIGVTRATQADEAFKKLKQEQQKLHSLQNAGSPEVPRDAWLLKLQETRVAAALAENEVRSDTSTWNAELVLQRARIELAELFINNLKDRVSFPESLLQSKRAEIQKTEETFDAAIKTAENQIKKFPSANPLKNNQALYDLLLDGLENQLQLLEYRRVGLMIQGQVIQSRYDLWHSSDAASIDKIAKAVGDRAQDVQAWQPLITGVRSRVQDRRRRALELANSNGSSSSQNIRTFVEKAFDQEEIAISKWENGFSRLLELIALTNADLDAKRKSLGVQKNFDFATTSLTSQAEAIWNTELFTLHDSVFVNGQVIQRPSPVTLGMLVTAVLILVGGGFVSAAFSRWIRRRLTLRFSLDANTGVIIEKFTHYFLLVGISLIALAVVRIPLTIFALLGGATAIAVGFGAQQLVNNLISGIILLFERPIRIGDLVDVGNNTGTVTSIGTRCCQLSRADGVEILIPNSIILQSTVINWTLHDTHSRQEMLIGIAYGSEVEKALRIAHEIAVAHPKVLKNNEPVVVLHDFGSDALILRMLFWIDRSIPGATLSIPSELRIQIYNAFNAAGIVLAFPQRDVHLNANTPLPVQVIPARQ